MQTAGLWEIRCRISSFFNPLFIFFEWQNIRNHSSMGTIWSRAITRLRDSRPVCLIWSSQYHCENHELKWWAVRLAQKKMDKIKTYLCTTPRCSLCTLYIKPSMIQYFNSYKNAAFSLANGRHLQDPYFLYVNSIWDRNRCCCFYCCFLCFL